MKKGRGQSVRMFVRRAWLMLSSARRASMDHYDWLDSYITRR